MSHSLTVTGKVLEKGRGLKELLSIPNSAMVVALEPYEPGTWLITVGCWQTCTSSAFPWWIFILPGFSRCGLCPSLSLVMCEQAATSPFPSPLPSYPQPLALNLLPDPQQWPPLTEDHGHQQREFSSQLLQPAGIRHEPARRAAGAG